METPVNGRITSREVFELIGQMEERLMERLDRLEDKMEHRIECNNDEIHRVESRINRQDGFTIVGSLIAAAIAGIIGWNK